MSKISSKISTLISSKYTVDRTTQSFLLTSKDDPKDRISTIIGDDKQPDTFYPQVKIMRWDNEVNLSVRLKDDQVAPESVTTSQEKIVWSKGIREVNFYDFTEDEGGYEFEVILKSKPATNKIEFTLQDKDVDYFYQSELTQEEIDRGDKRPDNVVGSYAVYAQTPKINWEGGKEYKCGKVGHIYRPKIIDSSGTEVWGDLHIENGILSVTIPQDFLDKAVYPIFHSSGLTFGYTTAGTTGSTNFTASNIRVAYTYAPASNGTINSISLYAAAGVASITVYLRGVLYKKSDNSLITYGAENTFSSPVQPTFALKTLTVTDASVFAGTDYNIGVWQNTSSDYLWIPYDTGAGFALLKDATAYHATNAPPSTFTEASMLADRKYSIYATYTAAAAGNLKTLDSNALANIKTIDGNAIANVKTVDSISLV